MVENFSDEMVATWDLPEALDASECATVFLRVYAEFCADPEAGKAITDFIDAYYAGDDEAEGLLEEYGEDGSCGGVTFEVFKDENRMLVINFSYIYALRSLAEPKIDVCDNKDEVIVTILAEIDSR